MILNSLMNGTALQWKSLNEFLFYIELCIEQDLSTDFFTSVVNKEYWQNTTENKT